MTRKSSTVVSVPGTPLEEWVAVHGRAALGGVSMQHIISWQNVTYILEGWDRDDNDSSE